MIKASCIVCGEPFEISIDEYLEDDEQICNDCSSAAYEFIVIDSIKPN